METTTTLPNVAEAEDLPLESASICYMTKSHRKKKILIFVLFGILGIVGMVMLVVGTDPQLESTSDARGEDRFYGTGDHLIQQDAPTGAPSSTPNSSDSTTQQQYSYQPLPRPIRVACAGDSLTLGEIGTTPGDDYPSRLQKMLGDAFETHNYGVNSVTAIRGLNRSYNKTQSFQNSIGLDADIYLLMLGTNDAKFWAQHSHKFANDMESTIRQATRTIVNASSPATRIMLAIPPWVKADYGGIKNDILVNSVQPAIRQFASTQQLQLVDMYAVTLNQNEFYIGDNLHLNGKGYEVLSQAWERAIICNHNDICETGENCETCPHDCRLNCT